jgi:hypothetical protein
MELTILSMHNSVALTMLTLYECHLHLSPDHFNCPKLKPCAHEKTTPFSPPPVPAASILLSVSEFDTVGASQEELLCLFKNEACLS